MTGLQELFQVCLPHTFVPKSLIYHLHSLEPPSEQPIQDQILIIARISLLMTKDAMENPEHMEGGQKIVEVDMKSGIASYQPICMWTEQLWSYISFPFFVTILYRRKLESCIVDGQPNPMRIHQVQYSLIEDWTTSGIISTLLLP